MQLILDTETTIDIKRNMSTLNEETPSEKVDVIQDLKSGLCNGNKENIQSNDNTISTDDKPLENDKVEDAIVSEPPIPNDDKERAVNIVKDKVGENITTNETEKIEDIISENSSHKMNEENLSVIEDPTDEADKSDPLEHKVISFNGIEESKKSENKEVIKQPVPTQIVSNDNSSSNGHECQPTIAQTEEINKTEEDLEEIKEVDGKVEVSEKVKNAEKEVVAEKVDENVESELKTDKNESLAEDDKIVEVNKKVYDSSKVKGCDEMSEKVVDQINKLGVSEISVVVNNESDAVTKNDVEINEIPVDINNESDTVTKNDVEINEIPIDINNESDTVTKNDVEVNEISVDVNNESDIVTKIDVQATKMQEDPITSPKQHTDQNPSGDPQMPNHQIVIEKTHVENVKKDDKTLNVQSNTDEIETVNLDDEEKEAESLKACTDIVNITADLNDFSETNNDSDKKEKLVIDMETVDLDDEKDVSETEPMDVDINNETGEVQIKDLPVSESSKIDDVSLECQNNRDGDLSTKENIDGKTENIELKNSVTPMDEDLHSLKSESSDKSVVSKEKENEQVFSIPINILDDEVDEGKNVGEAAKELPKSSSQQTKVSDELKNVPSILKLSNTLDILSDDEDEVNESQKTEPQSQTKVVENDADKKCISIDDDDDIMLIDEEDTNNKDTQNKPVNLEPEITEIEPKEKSEATETIVEAKSPEKIFADVENVTKKENKTEEKAIKSDINVKEDLHVKKEIISEVKPESPKPLVPNDFLKTCKKNMAEMTRDDLEEFCILKIVESVVDRSSLSEIKTKLKSMSQCIEEYKKKAMMLTKQNRDLQVVLKTIQEEQKNSKTVTPLKITRSVGMQVLMTSLSANARKKPPGAAMNANNNTTPTKSPRATNQRAIKVTSTPSPQPIPVPRLVPASNSPAAKNNMQQITTNTGKAASPVNGVRNNQQKAEKRPITRNHSVTVDLTDDEPPTKINRNSTPTPVRVVPPHMVPQNLLASTPRHPIGQNNNPRKVYIPISGPQNSNVRPGQAIMLKSVTSPSQSPRPRFPQPHMARMPQNQIRMSRVQVQKHPAPLPESNKIYPGNSLKALPPAPDLKLSKVENGIVISWKIDGYQEDSYEEIASYQLYAYQETSAPPNTALWKKIGDVKALPLPMACTLTQFMAGFKYYFAVRAVDIRSRIGPFSLPGSILLLNKL